MRFNKRLQPPPKIPELIDINFDSLAAYVENVSPDCWPNYVHKWIKKEYKIDVWYYHRSYQDLLINIINLLHQSLDP